MTSSRRLPAPQFFAGLLLILPVLAATLFAESPASRKNSSSPAHSQAEPATAPQSPQSPPAAVVVGTKTLFYVRERVFSFSPADRANVIMQNIRRLAAESPAEIRDVKTLDEETTTEIVSGQTVIMTITQQDAASAGKTRQALAAEYARVIQTAAESLRRETSMRGITFAILWAILATLIFGVILKVMAFLFPKLYATIRSWHGRYIKSIRIQKLELLPAQRITNLLLGVSRACRILLSLTLLYFYISLVFSFFPWTRGYADVLLNYTLYPVRTLGAAVAAYLPNVFFVVVILIASYYVVKVVKFFFTQIRKGTLSFPGFYADWAEPTYKITRFLIIAFTAIVVFPYLPGSKSPAFQGISIFLGLLFSLGSSSAVANVVAGVVLTYTRAFQLGDRVQVGDAVGDVTGKTLLVTRIRTIKNVDISIPNAMVLGSHIINYSSSAKDAGLILHTGVTIGYDAPWLKVHELLIAAAIATEDILGDPSPFVLQTSLNDFYVSYELNAYTSQPCRMAQTYSLLHQNIQDKFNEAGVEIMSPHYNSIRDGNTTAIPDQYLPREGKARSFRISSVDPHGSFIPKPQSEE
jgi:small-conductance mechanosensitive channel